MPFTDLIFQPFKLRCPQCQEYAELTFEEVQYNDELTCLKCGNVFTPNIDAQVLTKLVNIIEASLAEPSSVEKKADWDKSMDKLGKDGWKLVSTSSINMKDGETDEIALFFIRELE